MFEEKITQRKGDLGKKTSGKSKHGCGVMEKDPLMKIIQLKNIKIDNIYVKQRILLADLEFLDSLIEETHNVEYERQY